MKRRLAAMMMVVVLTGGSVMGCAGSGGLCICTDQGTAEAVSAQAAGKLHRPVRKVTRKRILRSKVM